MKKIAIFLIILMVIIVGLLSGCTESDGEDGFFDWLADDGPPEGGYDYCHVYCYATVQVYDPEGAEGHQVVLWYNALGGTASYEYYNTSEDGRLEQIYLGQVKLSKYPGAESYTTAEMGVQVYAKDNSGDIRRLEREITFNDASAQGTRESYSWVETFEITFGYV